MDKITIFIIILFWALGAIFKAVQKKEKEKHKEPSVPYAPSPRNPPPRVEMEFPLQEKSPEGEIIQMEDIYKLFEPVQKENKEAPYTPISMREPLPQKQASLEDLFHRPATQIHMSSQESNAPSGPIPVFMEKESPPPMTLKNGASFMDILQEKKTLSSWQKAIVLHEILAPPKTLRKKTGQL